jgi:hypothetical protein
LNSELLKNPSKSLKISSNKSLLCGNDREFSFDCIYSESTSQQYLFENSIKPNLERSLEGYNFSVLAYGQTVFNFK